MLKIVYCKDGCSVSDFEVYNFADATIRRYLCNRNDMEIRVSSSLAQDAFVLRTLEEKIPADEIAFYCEDAQLIFDREFGLEDPSGSHPNFFASITEVILKLGYANMRARKLSEKEREEA